MAAKTLAPSAPAAPAKRTWCCSVAHLLRDRINATTVGGSPMRAYLTRDGDFFVPLGTRVREGAARAGRPVCQHPRRRLHHPAARGASVFALSQGAASSAAARWLANKENQADLVGGVNVQPRTGMCSAPCST
jgi:N-acetylmuramoyl-L-alanine amidase